MHDACNGKCPFHRGRHFFRAEVKSRRGLTQMQMSLAPMQEHKEVQGFLIVFHQNFLSLAHQLQQVQMHRE